jgi:GNAT superfamily N-acetyltransferase
VLAVADRRIVGSLIGTFDGWRGNMYRLVVAPDHRRHGLGRRLVREVESVLAEWGATRTTALVEIDRPVAAAFWTEVGYPRDEHLARHAGTLAGITYRKLRASDDVDAITRMLHEAYAPLAAAGMRFVASHQDVSTTKARLARGETFVAVAGGDLIGIITWYDAQATQGSPFYDRDDVGHFGQFSVRPSHQRRGIGSRLIEIVEQRARDEGVSELALDTSERASDLIAMYSRKGYRFIEHAQWEDVNYRSVIMSKALRSNPEPRAPNLERGTLNRT